MAADIQRLEQEVRQWKLDNACKCCGAVPDIEGRMEHGRGCFQHDADGGGVSYIEPHPMSHAPSLAGRVARRMEIDAMTGSVDDNVAWATRQPFEYAHLQQRVTELTAELAQEKREHRLTFLAWCHAIGDMCTAMDIEGMSFPLDNQSAAVIKETIERLQLKLAAQYKRR